MNQYEPNKKIETIDVNNHKTTRANADRVQAMRAKDVNYHGEPQERRTVNNGSRKKKKKNKRRTRNRWLIGISIFLVLVLCAGIGIYALVQHYIGLINYEPFDGHYVLQTIPEDVTEETETDVDNIDEALHEIYNADATDFFNSGEAASASYVTNILLIGTDVRGYENRPIDYAYGNSDSMILVSINKKTKKITLTSFMRDMYVYIPVADTHNKLNYSHAVGGSDLLCETIAGNFKVKIDYYYRVDFYRLIDIIDAAGGIDMYVSEEEMDCLNKEYIYWMCVEAATPMDPEPYYLREYGDVHLTGMQAVAFARIRYVGNADFERTERQRRVISAIADNCKKMNLSQLNNFAQTVLPLLYTNMPSDAITEELLKVPDYLGYELVSQRVPFEGTSTNVYIDNKAYVMPDYQENAKKLIETIYD